MSTILPSHLQYMIREKLSKNMNKAALQIALGKQPNQPRNKRGKNVPWYITRNGRVPKGPGKAVSPPYFNEKGPLLKGKLTQRMKTHLKKVRNGNTTMKRDTYRIRPQDHYQIRVWNDTKPGWNYNEMNRIKKTVYSGRKCKSYKTYT